VLCGTSNAVKEMLSEALRAAVVSVVKKQIYHRSTDPSRNNNPSFSMWRIARSLMHSSVVFR
jgi:hypothetical protein